MERTTYHGFEALVLENNFIRVVMVPQLGAKIASLYDKTNAREWLLAPTLRPIRRVPYGAQFAAYDMSGWDEMFPTINLCVSPDEAFSETLLPDHGEVWTLAWEMLPGDDTVALQVSGRALPYTLVRAAALRGNTLQLAYTVTNTGDDPFHYLWAAHPLFATRETTRIVLPSAVWEVVNVMDDHPVWGKAETRYPFPQANGRQLDRVGSATLGECRKYYAPPETSVGEAGLRDDDTGGWLHLRWNAAQLPYLGVWVDEGCSTIEPCAALEPTNGYYDGVDRAVANRRAPLLHPSETQSWRVTVALGAGDLAF